MAVSMDRHKEILQGIIMEAAPLDDETPEETELRKKLEKEVADIVAKGQIPSMPFD